MIREYFTDHSTGEAMYRDNDGPVVQLTENSKEVIKELLEVSETFYPEQYKALSDIYSRSSVNKPFYDFLRARRIVSCCFGELDSMPDKDEFGAYHFEMVKCPLAAECKYHKIICQPKYKTSLTDAEMRVMELIYRNVAVEDIAERLFISIHTVKNHRRNALQRLKLHSTSEFIGYAHRNNLY